MWMDFWKENGIPLCFGIEEKCPLALQEAFLASYRGPTKHFQKYIVGWIAQDDLASENAIDRVWAHLAPVVEALVLASNQTRRTKS